MLIQATSSLPVRCSAKVDPSKMAECVSWPQACMIRYLLERGNLVFLGKRQTEFVIAIIST